MIERIDITGIKMDLDDDMKRYVTKKIGKLDRYLPRRARESAHADVRLKHIGRKHGNTYECEVVLHLPQETLTSKDSTLNIFAAIDIVEEKLKNQLKKYKDVHVERRIKAIGVFGRLKRGLGQQPEPAE